MLLTMVCCCQWCLRNGGDHVNVAVSADWLSLLTLLLFVNSLLSPLSPPRHLVLLSLYSHMAGGVAALWGAIILGPRLGRFHDKDGNPLDEPAEFAPHSVALQFLGTFCLWFGWYGFNPGSVLLINSDLLGKTAALVTVNTTLGACAGALSALFTSTMFDYWYTGVHTYDLAYTMNGCLTGLVAITAPAAVSINTFIHACKRV
jgi:ammonia channel protein AmtB